MADRTNGDTPANGPRLERLGEDECLRLIAAGGIGRLGYIGRFGTTIIPVTFAMHEGTVVFRTALGSPVDEDLRTGIAHAEYQVAFEIDQLNPEAREGWSVLIQGSAHHVDSEDELASVRASGVVPWAGGEREQYMRIRPSRITGRRIHRDEQDG